MAFSPSVGFSYMIQYLVVVLKYLHKILAYNGQKATEKNPGDSQSSLYKCTALRVTKLYHYRVRLCDPSRSCKWTENSFNCIRRRLEQVWPFSVSSDRASSLRPPVIVVLCARLRAALRRVVLQVLGLKRFHVVLVDLQSRAQLYRQPSQDIIPSHQQQGFPIDFLILESIGLFLESGSFKIINDVSDSPVCRVRELPVLHGAFCVH